MNKNVPFPSKPRRLNADEIELWLNAMRHVARRPGRSLPELPQRGAREGVEGASAHEPATALGGESAFAPAGRQLPSRLAPLDRRLRQRLARGRAAPDAAIDLHGMRRQEAFLALRAFLAKAQSEGARLVLVVTGKGDRPASGDVTPGILRQSVPQWLRGAEYRSIVAGFEEAARSHGGAGALYVKLRRRNRPVPGKPLP